MGAVMLLSGADEVADAEPTELPETDGLMGGGTKVDSADDAAEATLDTTESGNEMELRSNEQIIIVVNSKANAYGMGMMGLLLSCAIAALATVNRTAATEKNFMAKMGG